MKSINPHNGSLNAEFDALTDEQVIKKIEDSWNSFLQYKETDIQFRKEKLLKVASILEDRCEEYAKIISTDMGKPIIESRKEVKKTANHCKYCADNLERFLEPDTIKTEADKSVVEYHPLGPIYFIAPFNYPLWLVFKGAALALSVGNTILFKVASSCPRVGVFIDKVFKEAGFKSEFQLMLANQKQSELIISHKYIRGVSFTGSTAGGSIVAKLAGEHAKKSVMELGGSDPFVVLKEADISLAAQLAAKSRLMNAGQVCFCAKRFIIHESIYDDFLKALIEEVKGYKVGNPLDEDTKVGPLGSKKQRDSVESQIKKAEEQGAKLLFKGKKPEDDESKRGFYAAPMIYEVKEDSILFKEEIFGPIFAVIKFSTDEEAIRLANNTEYGLGGAVVSNDIEKAEKVGKQMECGSIFINEIVTSDSRMPSGGVKKSGYGRECSIHGAREFTNVKTVWIKFPEKQAGQNGLSSSTKDKTSE